MVLAVIYLLLAVSDAWITAKRIPQIGIEAEYNPMIRKLSYRYGIGTGVWVGVMIPALVLSFIGLYFPMFLVLLLGMRLTLFGFQMKVMNDGTNPERKRSSNS